MKIINNYNLESHNTFGIKSICDKYIEISTKTDIIEYFSELNPEKKFILLSGGSNILLPDYFNGDVLHIKLKGIVKSNLSDTEALFKVSTGEIWHSFVEKTVNESFIGMENMALIPGNVGTAPIQNIGAYGVEQEEYFMSLEGYNIESGEFESYTRQECEFGYRDSIFKNKLKGKFIITSVTYKLSKANKHNTSYTELHNYLIHNNLEVNSKNIFNAVVSIRQNKLPDPKTLGNSGSFFKNPIISEDKFKELQKKYPNLNGYPQGNGNVKISAGWLIDKTELKGFKIGNAGIYEKHALIIVNYGDATSSEVIDVANYVIKEVDLKFGIKLVPEVNII